MPIKDPQFVDVIRQALKDAEWTGVLNEPAPWIDVLEANNDVMPQLVLKQITEGRDKGDYHCQWSSDPLDFVIFTKAQIEHLISVAQAALND